jgi:hypothetical protein
MIVNKEADKEQSYFGQFRSKSKNIARSQGRVKLCYSNNRIEAVKTLREQRRADNSHSNNDQKKKKHLI